MLLFYKHYREIKETYVNISNTSNHELEDFYTLLVGRARFTTNYHIPSTNHIMQNAEGSLVLSSMDRDYRHYVPIFNDMYYNESEYNTK